MTTYNQIVALAAEITEEANSLAIKHTKAGSARQRKRINEIKKLGTAAKKELMAKDSE